MLNKKILMLTMVLVSLLAISAASAAENTTGDIADVASEDVVSIENNNQTIEQTENEETISVTDDGTFTALQNKINSASADSTLILENDYFFDDDFGSGRSITISKNNLTIDGNNHVIDALGNSGIFYINYGANEVTLKNINFINANANYNGAVHFKANDGKVINCTFKNTTNYGICVYFYGYDGKIVNSTFVNSTGYFDYASIHFAEWGEVINSKFINNDGAIIFHESGSVSDSIFINNSAYEGGGVYFYGYDLSSVINCEFINNTGYYGKGIFFRKNGLIVNSSFTNDDWFSNRPTEIHNVKVNDVIYDVSLFENIKDNSYIKLTKDYAIYSIITIAANDIVIDGNGKTISAGNNKIFSVTGNNVVFKNIIFDKVSMQITCQNFTFSNCSFINCSGAYDHVDDDEDVIVFKQSSGNIIDCTFANDDDYGGGVLSFRQSEVDVVNCNFTCDAELLGNTISIYNSDCDVVACNFTYGNGWGLNSISSRFSTVNISDCSFKGFTSSDYDGGAIHFGENTTANVADSTFTGFSSLSNGGAIFLDSRAFKLTASNCRFNGNDAKRGGAIYAGALMEINGCTFDRNNANGGGAIYTDAIEICICDCDFNENAANAGGALYLGGNPKKERIIVTSVEDSKFISNNASEYGGAIYSESRLEIDSCNFDDNSAVIGGAISTSNGIVESEVIVHKTPNGSITGYETIYYKQQFALIISGNTTFRNNDAGYGGAIDIGADTDAYEQGIRGKLTINDGVEFYRNSAECGGAIHVGLTDLNINSVEFKQNSANIGGAIQVLGYSNANILNSAFIDNEANGAGGSIFDEYNLKIENCSFATSKSQELVYCSNISGLSEGKLNFIGNDMQTNCRYCIVLNSSNAVLSDTYLIFENRSATKGNPITAFAKFVDDRGNVIAGPEMRMEISRDSNVVDSAALKFDSEIGGYGYGCNLTVGVYKVTGSLLSSENINCKAVEGKLQVSDIVMNAPDVIKYIGGGERFNVQLYYSQGGAIKGCEVKVTVNGKTSVITTDSNGHASMPLDLPVGDYDVVSECEGMSANSKVTVKSTIAVGDASCEYSNSKITATFLNVAGNSLANAKVTFKINGKVYAATTGANGIATANIDLGVGNYTVTAVNPVNNEQKQFELTISKASSNILLESSQNNGVTTLTATLTPAAATGNVVFSINGENKNAQIKDGVATLTLSNLSPGDYTATARYDGDNNLNADEKTVSFKVIEVETPTNNTDASTGNATDSNTGSNTEDNSSSSENTTDNNGSIKPDVTIPPLEEPSSDGSVTVNLPTDATGKVTLSINGKSYNFIVENGVANVIIPNLGEGNYPYTITYSGDSKYSSFTSNGTLNKVAPKVDPVIAADNVNAVYSAGTYYTIKVTGTDGKPANTVVKITGKISKTLTATNGVAKFKIDQVPGTYKITITALGKSVAKTITVKHLVTLKIVKVKKSAKKLVLQATLGKVNGKYLKNKKITFKFNGKKYTAKTNKKGVAKITIKSKDLKKLKVGKKVIYQATYLKDNVKKSVKVKK